MADNPQLDGPGPAKRKRFDQNNGGTAHQVPKSLYHTSVSVVVENFDIWSADIQFLPETVHFDILYKLYSTNSLCQLDKELSKLQTMAMMLKETDKRHLLHKCFQAVMDKGNLQLAGTLAEAYKAQCAKTFHEKDEQKLEKCVSLGISLGNFMCEAAWYTCADVVLVATRMLLSSNKKIKFWRKRMLDCGVRLIRARTENCDFYNALKMCDDIKDEIVAAEREGENYNKALFYSECSYVSCKQDLKTEATSYCLKALTELEKQGANQKSGTSLPPKAIIGIFGHCSIAFALKGDYKKAEELIKYAVQFAKETLGENHQAYAATLTEYGFYLVNVGSANQAVEVYKSALDIYKSVFGGNNLNISNLHGKLAFALYTRDFDTGPFTDARAHAEASIAIIHSIQSADQLSLASDERANFKKDGKSRATARYQNAPRLYDGLLAFNNRTLGVILEEMAIHSVEPAKQIALLSEAESHQLASLELIKSVFGEVSVGVANHYNYLGDLYEAWNRYKEAETMYLKSMEITQRLLGPDNYEVGKSALHLASMYRDMRKYDLAEEFYLKAIASGLKLHIEEGYILLKYAYEGLILMYQNTGRVEKYQKYTTILQSLNLHHNTAQANQVSPLESDVSTNMYDVFKQVLQMPSLESSN